MISIFEWNFLLISLSINFTFFFFEEKKKPKYVSLRDIDELIAFRSIATVLLPFKFVTSVMMILLARLVLVNQGIFSAP